ncbi:MAG: formylglycine-generating enzyme family protein [Kiritimatiellia bacterium]
MTTKRVLIGMTAMLVSVSAMADDPIISGVMVQQRWPWSRLVDIDYVLKCDLEQSIDIGVSAYNGTELLDVPGTSFSGDLYGVSWGTRRIVWDPTVTAYTNNGAIPEFRVALTATPVPLYMIVDLTKSAGEAGQTEYVYESALTNGLWGAWVRNPVTNDGTAVQSVIWTGVKTNDIYKTDKLVLRRIPKGEFKVGASVPAAISTTLTKDFYAGVFQVTQKQWQLLMGDLRSWPSYWGNETNRDARPVEMVSYDDIRGAMSNNPTVNWPATGVAVMPSSFVGRLRAQTGLTDFDLPTEAQWECLCRAGMTTYYNDGIAGSPNSVSNAQIDVLGRYQSNGGQVWNETTGLWESPKETAGTTMVGSYLPNAWGLYDTHGNVCEWCLDWWTAASLQAGGSDPAGAASGTTRAVRGGSWMFKAAFCRSSYSHYYEPNKRNSLTGFRLVRTLP